MRYYLRFADTGEIVWEGYTRPDDDQLKLIRDFRGDLTGLELVDRNPELPCD